MLKIYAKVRQGRYLDLYDEDKLAKITQSHKPKETIKLADLLYLDDKEELKESTMSITKSGTLTISIKGHNELQVFRIDTEDEHWERIVYTNPWVREQEPATNIKRIEIKFDLSFNHKRNSNLAGADVVELMRDERLKAMNPET